MALDQTRATEGWIHMCQVLKENIKLLEDMILSSEGELTKDEEKILKLKRAYLLKLIDLPVNLMKNYQSVPSKDREFDPYD